MTVAFTNFASTTIQGALTTLSTSITVATTTGANFPATAGNKWFYIVLTDSLVSPTVREVIKVTTRSGDNFSVCVRARDGTTAQNWPSGTYCQLRLTMGTFADLDVQYANNADNLSNLASAATARTNLGLGSIATQAASAVAITGGTITGTPISGSTVQGAIGGITPSTVAATTISASGVITSTQATGTAPFTIASTTVVGNLNVSQLLGATWTAPGTIGSVTPSSGAFTTLSASGAVSGVGFSNYLASPPAIGGSSPAAGTFTAIVGTTIRATTYINYRGGDNASQTNSGFGETALDSNAGGTGNTAVGYAALTANTTGSNNTAIGIESTTSNLTGSSNVCVGYRTLYSSLGSGNTVAIGSGALQQARYTNYSIAIGTGSLGTAGGSTVAGSFVVGVVYTILTSGTTNFTLVGAANNAPGTVFTATGVGAGTGTAASASNYNTSIGYNTCPLATTATSNTVIGSQAGATLTTGNNNTLIGTFADVTSGSLTNVIAIGYNTNATASNQVIIGNAAMTEYYLPGTAAHFKYAGSFSSSVPVTETAATHTVALATSDLIANRAGTITVTLPAAATYPGRELHIKTITANTVVSNASNVVPLIGGAAATGICAGVAGSWARLKSDGTNWIIMAGA